MIKGYFYSRKNCSSLIIYFASIYLLLHFVQEVEFVSLIYISIYGKIQQFEKVSIFYSKTSQQVSARVCCQTCLTEIAGDVYTTTFRDPDIS